MVIARNRALAVHHVTVHAFGGRLSVSLDLEVDGSLSLSAAHDIADGLEAAVRAELGPTVEVETHIEPLQMRGISGREASNERIAAVQAALAALTADVGFVATSSTGPHGERHGLISADTSASTHRAIAFTSIGVGTLGYLVMLIGH